jgi:GntP family permease
LFFSHVNDAGFWLVKEHFGMIVGQTLRSWSIMETIVSVTAADVSSCYSAWSSDRPTHGHWIPSSGNAAASLRRCGVVLHTHYDVKGTSTWSGIERVDR